MQETFVLKFKISDELIDKPLLPKNEILKYDMNYCYEQVEKKIDEYILAQSYYPNIMPPTITSNYEIKYECFVPRKVDKVEGYVSKKVDKEEEIKRLYSDISLALSGLSKNEFTYFLDCLYYKRSENSYIEKVQTTRFLFGPIKDSCIIKLAKSLDVLKEKS